MEERPFMAIRDSFYKTRFSVGGQGQATGDKRRLGFARDPLYCVWASAQGTLLLRRIATRQGRAALWFCAGSLTDNSQSYSKRSRQHLHYTNRCALPMSRHPRNKHVAKNGVTTWQVNRC